MQYRWKYVIIQYCAACAHDDSPAKGKRAGQAKQKSWRKRKKVSKKERWKETMEQRDRDNGKSKKTPGDTSIFYCFFNKHTQHTRYT